MLNHEGVISALSTSAIIALRPVRHKYTNSIPYLITIEQLPETVYRSGRSFHIFFPKQVYCTFNVDVFTDVPPTTNQHN